MSDGRSNGTISCRKEFAAEEIGAPLQGRDNRHTAQSRAALIRICA
jgi:hypothetical protein